MKLSKSETAAAKDSTTLAKWERGDISTAQACKQIAEANHLDIEFVTERELHHLAEMCGYWRNNLTYKNRFFPE